MTLSLHQVINLPAETSMSEFARVVDLHFHAAFEKAARGETSACDELLELRVAYLNWAYRPSLLRPDRKEGDSRASTDSGKPGSHEHMCDTEHTTVEYNPMIQSQL